LKLPEVPQVSRFSRPGIPQSSILVFCGQWPLAGNHSRFVTSFTSIIISECCAAAHPLSAVGNAVAYHRGWKPFRASS